MLKRNDYMAFENSLYQYNPAYCHERKGHDSLLTIKSDHAIEIQ